MMGVEAPLGAAERFKGESVIARGGDGQPVHAGELLAELELLLSFDKLQAGLDFDILYEEGLGVLGSVVGVEDDDRGE